MSRVRSVSRQRLGSRSSVASVAPCACDEWLASCVAHCVPAGQGLQLCHQPPRPPGTRPDRDRRRVERLAVESHGGVIAAQAHGARDRELRRVAGPPRYLIGGVATRRRRPPCGQLAGSLVGSPSMSHAVNSSSTGAQHRGDGRRQPALEHVPASRVQRRAAAGAVTRARTLRVMFCGTVRVGLSRVGGSTLTSMLDSNAAGEPGRADADGHRGGRAQDVGGRRVDVPDALSTLGQWWASHWRRPTGRRR